MNVKERFVRTYHLYKGKAQTKYARKVGQEKYGNSLSRYAGKKMLSADEMNEYIFRGLNSGKPFMVSRFGSTELTSLSSFYFHAEADYGRAIEHVCFYSGFFPNDISLGRRFTDVMLDAFAQTDALAVWFVQFEEYFAKKLLSEKAQVSYLMNIEPWKSIFMASSYIY